MAQKPALVIFKEEEDMNREYATISIMDYIGTFAFALSGAYLAIRYELDIFGIFVCAFSTACGGGITVMW